MSTLSALGTEAMGMMEDLDSEQFRSLDRVVQRQRAVSLAEQASDTAQAVRDRAVYDCVLKGVPVKTVATALGVSLGSVYGMRRRIMHYLDD